MNWMNIVLGCSLLLLSLSTLVHSNQNNSKGEHELIRRDTARQAPEHHNIAKNDHCIVKGSYCQCHYCRCEKGQLHCKEDPKKKPGYGKRYCYGSMEGEHCHCDYCKCRHGYGHEGWASCH